jgi:predicted nucleotidyltransferase
MTTSFDASAIAELDPLRAVLQEISQRADATGVEVMIVGAAARDLLIRHDLGAPPKRATLDIDIAVAVATWTEVMTLTNGLTEARGGTHTFSVAGMEVDIIPFGSIESTSRTIFWPDDHEMNVFGFREALSAAVQVKLSPELTVLVASLPAQSLLKLMAWHDRHHVTSRDAIDLRTIFDAYSTGRYLEGLYAEHAPLLESFDYDPLLAGAALLGKETAALLSDEETEVIRDLLADGEQFTVLAADMGGRPSIDREVLAAYQTGFDREVASTHG